MRSIASQADALAPRLEAAARRLGTTVDSLTAEIVEVWLLRHEEGFSAKVGKYD
jgi:hypothetical protein